MTIKEKIKELIKEIELIDNMYLDKKELLKRLININKTN